MNRSPDWSLWRSFAAVVAAGSLSAAARNLGLSQPTLGRHVETLEAELGVPLFERTLTGLKPTATALRLFEPVNRARDFLAEAALIAEGMTEEQRGTVRITASAVTSTYILPQLLPSIREQYPAIALEIVPSDSAENLLMREADIAIRMFRPTQLELVTRKLGEMDILACAHQSYLDRRGMPTSIGELQGHDIIGFDRSDQIIQHARALGWPLTRDDFALRTDDQVLLWELTKAGLGISFAQAGLIRRSPGMVALPVPLQIPPLPIWLTTHRELFTSHRIRAIYDALASGLTTYISEETARPSS